MLAREAGEVHPDVGGEPQESRFRSGELDSGGGAYGAVGTVASHQIAAAHLFFAAGGSHRDNDTGLVLVEAGDLVTAADRGAEFNRSLLQYLLDAGLRQHDRLGPVLVQPARVQPDEREVTARQLERAVTQVGHEAALVEQLYGGRIDRHSR